MRTRRPCSVHARSAFAGFGFISAGLRFGSSPNRFCRAMVFMRAMSRRTTRTREVFSN